jgi:hypothetical protein
VDFDGFDLACADDLVAFANTVFLGVGFGAAFAFALPFGTGVSNGVGFGNSISLFACANDGCSFSSSSDFKDSDLTEGTEIFEEGAAILSDFSAARSSAPLNQTKSSLSGALRAAKLHRINPATSATCASAISVTFRQNRPSLAIAVSHEWTRMDTNS